MKISDKEIKLLLQEAMKNEADAIMKEVNSVPELQNVVAPEELREKLFEQIQKLEEGKKESM